LKKHKPATGFVCFVYRKREIDSDFNSGASNVRRSYKKNHDIVKIILFVLSFHLAFFFLEPVE